MSDLKAKDSNLLSMSYNTYYTNGSENNWESNIYGYHNSRMKGWIQEQDYYLKKSFDNNQESMLSEATNSIYDGQQGPLPSSLDMDSEDLFKKKSSRDPLSHRIIEKRRRDRMNSCLADLSRLIPAFSMKKGRGRIEKTEIVEMAIKHIKDLELQLKCNKANHQSIKGTTTEKHKMYSLGFRECMLETVKFLLEVEGLIAEDGLCHRLVTHLKKYSGNDISSGSEEEDISKMHSEKNGHLSSPNAKTDLLENSPPNTIITDLKKTENNSKIDGQNSTEQLISSSDSPNLNEVYKVKDIMKKRFQADRRDQIKKNNNVQKVKCSGKRKETIENTKSDEAHSQGSVYNSSSSTDSSNSCLMRSPISSGFRSGSGSSRTGQAGTTYIFENQNSHFPYLNNPQGLPNNLQTSNQLSQPSLPGFALHPSGSFYVPIRLEPTHVAPYILNHTPLPGSFPNLHPISISVSFCNFPSLISNPNPFLNVINHA